MSEAEGERRVKKSEILALENVKRIAEQLRSERNDALALAQVMREKLEATKAILRETKVVLERAGSDPNLAAKISAFLADKD